MRPRTRTEEEKAQQLRDANRRAYAKKTGKQLISNQYGPTDMISGKSLEYYRQKHAAYEGTRLEKSENPPIFLSPELRKQQAEK